MTIDTSPAPLRVLITGATGFVGSALVKTLDNDLRYVSISVVRSKAPNLSHEKHTFCISELSSTTDWRKALMGCAVVVHAAARVHVMNEVAADALAEFRKVNVAGTVRLAQQAADAGVRRFVFISSVKVNGECTDGRRPFVADDVPAPVDPYGVSKHEAEESLRRISVETGMEVVIIRPTLVYGPGVKANFRNMMGWLKKGVPLPFGAIHNKRSLVSIDNLVSLITVCLNHPKAAGETFLASDGVDLSTTELLKKTAFALGVQSRLLPIPAGLLTACAIISGRRSLSQRLCGSLQVDIQKAQTLLGWSPPVSIDDALNRTAKEFLGRH